ncbi:MAG: hypothetical protein DRN04_11380 [Thermoprotei archaeon]|nr:MAG: hypothetical protein DRN04_11380 [Thermoprotei archaeon]
MVVEQLVFQIGVGGILGFSTGYTIKKIVKFLLLVLGIFMAILLYLDYSRIITINYDRLAEVIYSIIQIASSKASGLQEYIKSQIPFAASFSVGLILGLKKG